jgi:hypothetical protein
VIYLTWCYRIFDLLGRSNYFPSLSRCVFTCFPALSTFRILYQVLYPRPAQGDMN